MKISNDPKLISLAETTRARPAAQSAAPFERREDRYTAEARPLVRETPRHVAATRALPAATAATRNLVSVRAWRPTPTLRGDVGTFPASRVDDEALPEVRYSIPWDLERPLAIRGTEPRRLALALRQRNVNGVTLFDAVTQAAFRTLSRGVAGFTGAAEGPGRYKVSESDYYDTPDFALFRADYSMALRTKVAYDDDGTARKLELQLLSDTKTDDWGLKFKGNTSLTAHRPTPELAAHVERDFLNDSISWNGEQQDLTPLRRLRSVLVDAGHLGADEPLQLESKMHYRGESHALSLPRPSLQQMRDQIKSVVVDLDDPQLQTVVEDLVDRTVDTWQAVESFQSALEGLPLDTPRATLLQSNLQNLLLTHRERVFVPEVEGLPVEVSVQSSSVIDPDHWQGLPPDDKTPRHVPPSEALWWGWLRVTAELDGGFAPHIERMTVLRQQIDHDRQVLIAHALAGLQMSPAEAGQSGCEGTLVKAVEALRRSSQSALDPRVLFKIF